MGYSKITDADLVGVGVLGQPDVPGLSARDMQLSVEGIPREVIIPKFNQLVDDIAERDKNTYTKTEANKAINDAVNEAMENVARGEGDMLKSVYDKDNDGVVDKAKLADSAKTAQTAEAAVTAQSAGYATTAGTAESANRATTADRAGHATTAGSSGTAESATNANNAAKAGKLANAVSIGKASFDGSKSITLEQMGAMPADGGEMTGVLKTSSQIIGKGGSEFIKAYNSDGEALKLMHLSANNNLVIGSGLSEAHTGDTYIYTGCQIHMTGNMGEGNYGVKIAPVTSSTADYCFGPVGLAVDNMFLGTSSNKWKTVYATTGTIQTSDAREKENIVPLGTSPVATYGMRSTPEEQMDIHSELFDRLQPVQFNFINGDGRVNYGLVAQDVVAAMEELGMDENELDLVHHDFWTDEETGEEKEVYGLSYNNLIPMLIHEVQKLKAEVKRLTAMVEE